ncbi:MAG: ribonuclease HII [Myxococcota bacterium]
MSAPRRVIGIDEAGRGCVLGDLCVGAFFAVDPDDLVLRAAGADDSKRLSEKKREAAREALAGLGEPAVVRITAQEIDQANLNHLELHAIAGLVRRFRPDHVYMDALGPPKSVPGLVERLRELVGDACDPQWTIEPKADHTYPIVGAASIFAKTTRDRALAELDASHGPLGSGYPSDPVTKAWLSGWAARREPWPPFVRTRWQTIQDLGQQSLL